MNYRQASFKRLFTRFRRAPPTIRPIELDFSAAIPFDYHPAAHTSALGLAVICHIFYADMVAEFGRYLQNIPFPFDLFISTDTESKEAVIRRFFANWMKGSIDIRLVKNQGRDIAPKFVSFRDVYSSYEYVLHLHSKRSDHAGFLANWRGFLLNNLIGSTDIVNSIFAAFSHCPRLGIIASQHFEPIRPFINWGANFEISSKLANRMGITLRLNHALDFPSGSMFWARSAALKPLVELNLTFDDFPSECGQLDGTLAHAVERLSYFVCERAGFRWIKVSHPKLFNQTGAIVRIEGPSSLDRFLAEKTPTLIA